MTAKSSYKYLLATSPLTISYVVLMIWTLHDPRGGFTASLFDDAMISMQYAKTFSESGTLAWFPGGEPIQGFTNLGYTLWLSVLHLLGASFTQVALIVVVSNFLLLHLTSRIIADIIEAFGTNHIYRNLTIASFATAQYSLLFWSVRGLEVAFLTYLSTLVLRGVLDITVRNRTELPRIMIPVLAAAAGQFVRQDFLIYVVGASIAPLAYSTTRQRVRSVAPLLAALLVLLALLTFSYVYFGDPLPNTYYLKSTPREFWIRLGAGVTTSLKVVPLLLVIIFAILKFLRATRKDFSCGTSCQRLTAVTAFSFIFFPIAYSTYIGGDAWEWSGHINRFIVPALPAVVAIAASILTPTLTILSARSFLKLFAIFVVLSGLLGGVITPNLVTPRFIFSDVRSLAVVFALFAAMVFSLAMKYIQGTTTAVIAASLSALIVPLNVPAFAGQISPQNLSLGQPLHVGDDQFRRTVMEEWSNVLPEDLTILMTTAGAPSYFLSGTFVDYLGKSDPKVARGALMPADSFAGSLVDGVLHFHPGHNKWDFDYSVREIGPDIIVNLWLTSADERDFLEKNYGFVCLGPNRLRVKKETLEVVLLNNPAKLSDCSSS